MNLWEERAARNEALFREVNERVEELHDQLASGGTAVFVCECAEETCTDRISVPLTVYERVRSDPHLFLVADGHVRAEVEHVVEKQKGFVIVAKDEPTAARVAEQTDPRA
jgi:predicted ATPase